MRSRWLAAALLAVGCFSESPSAGGCVDGDAACDCKSDGTCNEGNDCIASIDKCVPSGCTPGSESCTCVDDACLGALVCSEGVCMTPDAATTGGGVSMSESISDTVADTGTATTPGTTDPSMTDPSMTDPSAATIPPDTDTSNPTDATETSMTTDPTSATAMTDASAEDTSVEGCPACIAVASDNECSTQFNMCLSNPDCQDIHDCIISGSSVIDCCPLEPNDDAVTRWNELVSCAGMFACNDDNCQLICLAQQD